MSENELHASCALLPSCRVLRLLQLRLPLAAVVCCSSFCPTDRLDRRLQTRLWLDWPPPPRPLRQRLEPTT